MVVGLGVRPSVRFGQILQSLDEIRSGNGVLAFGTKEFRNLVLLHSEVEVRRSVCSSGSRGGRDVDVTLACGIAGVVVIGVYIDIGILEVIVLRARLMSSVPVLVAAIFAVCKLYFSYKQMPGFSDPLFCSG